MKLHQSLADLARDHGHDLFRDATAFRGSLDDYLDEGQASSGTINLLTDAVRLGALDGMVTMLDSGANPADAVESAGQRLARDRGSADVRGCQWAVAVLGFALGKVPENLVTGLDPDAGTTAPPPPPGQAPIQSPVQSPLQSPVTSPVAHPQQPIVSPPHQPVPPVQPGAGSYGAPNQPYGGGWSQPAPPQKKSRKGLVLAAVVAVLVLVVGGIIAAVALSGGDDDKTADGGDDPTTTATDDSSSVPDIGGERFEGLGYQLQVPRGWTDGTEEFKSQNSDVETLDKVFLWGDTFNTARGNVIVETQSSYGYTDPNDLKDNWKTALVSGDTTAEVEDGANVSIDGQTALTVDIARTNDGGVNVVQRSHLVISGDKGYSITVSLKEGDDDVLEQFEKILTTWQWTS
ncbi:MAG TPA: hypothetical protein VNS46_11080 [Nocardioides sp.]|nr:hypothetical protein [Nocardioides sp.]